MKGKIRKEINFLRDKKPDAELRELSVRIKENLFRLPEFVNAKNIMFYVSTRSEVRTEDMIRESLMMGKNVCVPRTNTEENSLRCMQISDLESDLERGAFGILEPAESCSIEIRADNIDLVIVPGTAFDMKGNRIGYGKGFYDRLLPKMGHAATVGLAYGFQIVDSVPAEEHDVEVKIIVTEDGAVKV